VTNIEDILDRKERRKRRRRLLALIKAVLEGKIDSTKVPTDELLKFHEFATREYGGSQEGRATRQYVNPKDRNTNNYGYMELVEMWEPLPHDEG
jgi:hypothetical protein